MRIAELTAIPDKRAMWIRSGPEYALPSLFYVDAQLDDPPCIVRMNVVVDSVTSTPVIAAITIERVEDSWPFGPGVTTARLRAVGLDALLQRALVLVREPVVPVVPEPDGHTGAFQLKRELDAGRSNVAHVSRGARATPGRGKRTPDEYLQRVADIYMAAVADGSAPTKAVQASLIVGYSTAGRLVGLARKKGLLPPTTKGKATKG